MSIDVCIGNYGYYNEGELRDAWISLPKTSKEIGDFLSAHGLQDPEHEEIYISDYDGVPFGLRGLFDEYTHLDDLNMLARQMEAHPGAVETVKGALGCGIDHPESVIGLMNWIEQADEIPYYAYDYPGAGRKDEWDQTEVERNSAEENYARTVIFRDEDKLRALMALDEVGLDHDMYFDFEKYGRSDDLSGYVNLGDGGYFPHMSKSGKADGDVSKTPWLPEGTHLIAAIACEITEGETTPPVPYTEGTLIADMASIAKYVTDPEVAEILKRKDDGKKGEHGGIGTTATRASIIEKLKDRGYIEDVKGKIRSTEKGRAFYRVLPPEISGADVTARWWLIQQDIAEGRADVNALQESVVEVFNAHKETAYVGASIAVGGTAVGKCPICGADVVQKKGKESGKPYYTCSTNRSEQQEDGTYKALGHAGDQRRLRAVRVAHLVKLHLIVLQDLADLAQAYPRQTGVAGDEDGLEGLTGGNAEVVVVAEGDVLIRGEAPAIRRAHVVATALELAGDLDVGRAPAADRHRVAAEGRARRARPTLALLELLARLDLQEQQVEGALEALIALAGLRQR